MLRSRVLMVALIALIATVGGASCTRGTPRPVDPPENAQDPDFSWFITGAAEPGRQVMLAVTRADPAARNGRALLVVHGSDGLNRDYLVFARELRAFGFDVAVGCWAHAGAPRSPSDPLIECPNGPAEPGVTEEAAAEVDRLVDATLEILDEPGLQLTVIGFSRGGGVVGLRNSFGHEEPTVIIAGMVQGWSNYGSTRSEVDVTRRVATFAAPTLVLHGALDGIVPPTQAEALVEGLRGAGKNVALKVYPREGHGLLQSPDTRKDIIGMIATWALDPSPDSVSG